ncbi:MAG: Glycosyl transferases group 1 [Bacteroidetes bacterium ADurb.Bin174]|nr:MAG: Glycosyl transferases group 1 [Bacteroidetes bacterium ADurb.Bin174]
MNKQKKSLLIVNHNQFGHAAGIHHYCKYLKNDFEIDFLCFDRGLTKINESGINVIYHMPDENRAQRHLSFIFHAIIMSRQKDYNTVFCVYFRWVYLLGLFCEAREKILAIHTGSLNDNRFQRFLYNRMTLFSCLFFDKVISLSYSLANLLKLPQNKRAIVPLGANVLDDTIKQYDKMHLLYIGTLHKRQIEKTIEGFSRFHAMHGGKVSLRYDIIGFSHIEDDVDKIKDAIKKNNLSEIIKFHGRKHHQELKQYIKNATIGVCFVPQTPYYDVQPSTKIFEYALSGLITIATDTGENRKYINDVNGVICQDNENSFCAALEKVYESLGKYDDSKIRQSLSEYHWGKIVKNILLPILRN